MNSIYFLFNQKHSWRNAVMMLMLLTLSVVSCMKKNEMELNKGNAPLTLSANKTSIVLKQKEDASDALVFTWTTGSNHGTNAGISYTFKIDRQGNNFKNAVTEQLGKAALTRKYSVKELNNLLLAYWNLAPGQEATLEAKVIATVSGNPVTMDSTSSVTIKITPYAPVTTNLYLIGNATPNGWNANMATAMTAVANQPGSFTWLGHLNPGDFKFITTLGQFLPSYNKGADSLHLTYRTDNSQPDNKFTITATGNYNITVSLLDSTIKITAGNTPPYTALWIVGDATPNGWNIGNPNKMVVDSSNLFVFNYNEVLTAGEFKIPVATGNWGTDYYMPLTNHPPVTSTGVQFVPGGSPETKWQITNPGRYKIRLDLQAMTINIKPFTPYTQIWMVGDATPAGWNINSPQPLTVDPSNPNIFTYTGPMNAGEFKFPLATGNWGCDYFMPVIDQSGPGSTQMKFVAGGNPDQKWRLTQAGTYVITIDQLHETISIVKQ